MNYNAVCLCADLCMLLEIAAVKAKRVLCIRPGESKEHPGTPQNTDSKMWSKQQANPLRLGK